MCIRDRCYDILGDGVSRIHLDDLWVYNPEFNRWLLIEPVGEKPSERSHHQWSYIPAFNTIFLYGGKNHDSDGNWVYLEDAWSFTVGCPNSCSGNGVCESIVCNCDACWGDADCSRRYAYLSVI
eukprot:TRINITY_DN405_c0_g1_i2.p1 TRINITY_DN405_c0_g1~~TRINITY_DN405_c0_g1_i2.p1  ORF type:complete len:124 (+),score=2.35 TRINITY_DN405_c0_g1_i2:51-422(+)